MHFLQYQYIVGQFSKIFYSIFTCIHQGFFHYGILVFDKCLGIQVKRKMRGKEKTIDLSNNKSITLNMCSSSGEYKRIINPNLKESD